MAALSYVSGVSDEPLLGTTIGQALARAAERWPERPALISPSHGVAWSWRELRERARNLASGLLALGLKRGERIGCWSLNRPEWTLTQFAAAEAGLVFVTINPAYRLHELRICAEQGRLRRAGHGDAVQVERLHRHDEHARPGTGGEPAGRVEGRAAAGTAHGDPDRRAGAGDAGLRRRRRRARRSSFDALDALAPELQFDDPANIQFTSGTTGSPKGVTLSHHNILNNGYFTGRAMRLTPEDRICIPVPLYHCFGMVMGNLAAVTLGAAMVYPGEGFDPLGDAARPSRRSAAPRSTACRRCSSPNSTIPSSSASISQACAPASWRARRVRSR